MLDIRDHGGGYGGGQNVIGKTVSFGSAVDASVYYSNSMQLFYTAAGTDIIFTSRSGNAQQVPGDIFNRSTKAWSATMNLTYPDDIYVTDDDYPMYMFYTSPVSIRKLAKNGLSEVFRFSDSNASRLNSSRNFIEDKYGNGYFKNNAPTATKLLKRSLSNGSLLKETAISFTDYIVDKVNDCLYLVSSSNVIKQDLEGNTLWTVSTSVIAGLLTLDKLGNVYLVGRNAGYTAIAKINANGALVFQKTNTTGPALSSSVDYQLVIATEGSVQAYCPFISNKALYSFSLKDGSYLGTNATAFRGTGSVSYVSITKDKKALVYANTGSSGIFYYDEPKQLILNDK
ncbi:hypothetical protein ACWS7L_07395 [Exiguobacterium artemiae]